MGRPAIQIGDVLDYQSQLKEGENTVTLSGEGGQLGCELGRLHPTDLSAPYSADQDELKFTAGGAAHPQTIDGFSNSSIRVIDITDPSSPQEEAGAVERGSSGYQVTVETAGRRNQNSPWPSRQNRRSTRRGRRQPAVKLEVG